MFPFPNFFFCCSQMSSWFHRITQIAATKTLFQQRIKNEKTLKQSTQKYIINIVNSKTSQEDTKAILKITHTFNNSPIQTNMTFWWKIILWSPCVRKLGIFTAFKRPQSACSQLNNNIFFRIDVCSKQNSLTGVEKKSPWKTMDWKNHGDDPQHKQNNIKSKKRSQKTEEVPTFFSHDYLYRKTKCVCFFLRLYSLT
jgi:hypothetical protein